MATVASTVSEPAKRSWRGDDFPTWLSPMLVKELRQGIQSGVFAWTFMALQAVMFLVVASALAAGASGAAAGGAAAAFWLPVTLAVAVVIPLRGLGAISSERVGNGLDLVRLTHLSATRIVVGKWLAIVAQSALLAVAVLPYLVLRYFFGGVNVVRDLAAFGWMLAGAMLVAAAAVAASTRPLRERIGLVILMLILGNGFTQTLFFVFGGYGGGAVWTSPAFGVALVGLYVLLLLEYAAAAIAPAAENHAARKRLLGLVIVVGWLAAAASGSAGVFPTVAFATLLPLVMLAVEALCERPSSLASIHAPFVRLGMAGRVAALALAPGWASGLVFVTLVAVVCVGSTVAHAGRFAPGELDDIGAIAVLVYATLVFPLPAVVLFAPRRRRQLLYGFVQLACLFVLVFQAMATMGYGRDESPLAMVALFPLAALLWAIGAETQARFTLGVAAIAVTIVVFALVTMPWARDIGATDRRIRAARDRTGGRTAEDGE